VHVASNPGYSGFLKRRYDRPNERVEQIVVRTDTLDNIVDPCDQIALIKADVEGAEYLVFKGAKETIKRCKPVIVFECGLGGTDVYGVQPEQMYELLCGDCDLRISLLQDFLDESPPLTLRQFCEQFHKGLNYYFVAHP